MWASSLSSAQRSQNRVEPWMLLPSSSERSSDSNLIHAYHAVIRLRDPSKGGFPFGICSGQQQSRPIFICNTLGRGHVLQSSPSCKCNALGAGHVQKPLIMGAVVMVQRCVHKQAVFAIEEVKSGMLEASKPEESGIARVDRTAVDFSSSSTLVMDMPDNNIEGGRVTEPWSGLARALCQAGLSEMDSSSIASKAPVTVRSLISAAVELEEFASWTAQQPSTQQDLHQKTYEVAVANPSRQFAALIESIGVDERKISRVCHYLVSQNIADVLHKIRLLEDVFPNEKDDGIVIRTRRMMREMSLSVDVGLQKTLSFFEKMEAKRGGTSMLNIPREVMPHVIEEFPEILVRDLELDLKSLMNYFEEIGVPKENVSSVVMCFPSILLYRSVEELRTRLQTLKKEASVRPRNFGKMVMKYPWILSRCVESNVKPLSDYLRSVKVPPGKVGQCITKCPNLLGSSSVPLQTMTQHLISTGVKRVTLGNILVHYPQLLLRTPRSFDEIVRFLKGWGLEDNDILKLLLRCPPIFASTVTYLRMKITLLQRFGIRNQRLKRVLLKHPQFLMQSLENSLKPRLRLLQSTGLSNEDIAFMICGFPALLSYSIDDVLRPKLDVLENVLCHPVKELVTYPRYFSYCTEKRILHRFRILKRAKVELDLKSMLSPSDHEFAELYLGIGHILVPPV